MKFFNPTLAFVEENCVRNHAEDIKSLGTKAYIVTGRSSSRKNGSLDDVLSVLHEAGTEYVIFDQVEENPSVETVEVAAELGKQFGADFVIGIGGGSPMDAAKSIAVLMANPEENGECLRNARIGLRPALPLCAVPTTCGTGSEITAVSVLTYHELGTKKSMPYKVFPKLALIDGKYLLKAPMSIIVSTAVDALAHLIESYLNSAADTYNRMISSYGLQLWGEIKECLKLDSLDIEMAEKLMLTSTVAGMAISQTGTSIPHYLSYTITYEHGVSHGRACGMFLSEYVKLYEKHNKVETGKICGWLGFEDTEAFAAYLRELIGTVEITEKECDLYVANLLGNKGKLATFPYEISPEDALKLYTGSLNIAE